MRELDFQGQRCRRGTARSWDGGLPAIETGILSRPGYVSTSDGSCSWSTQVAVAVRKDWKDGMHRAGLGAATWSGGCVVVGGAFVYSPSVIATPGDEIDLFVGILCTHTRLVTSMANVGDHDVLRKLPNTGEGASVASPYTWPTSPQYK